MARSDSHLPFEGSKHHVRAHRRIADTGVPAAFRSRVAAAGPAAVPLREVPVDWEALEDAFENNAPEVHSYLHLTTGEVLRVVDGVADPQMHARIASDPQLPAHRSGELARAVPLDGALHPDGRRARSARKARASRSTARARSAASKTCSWRSAPSARAGSRSAASGFARSWKRGSPRTRSARSRARMGSTRRRPEERARSPTAWRRFLVVAARRIGGPKIGERATSLATPKRAAQHLKRARRSARSARSRHARFVRRVLESAARGARLRASSRAHAIRSIRALARTHG